MSKVSPDLNSCIDTDDQLSRENKDILLETKFFIPRPYSSLITRPRLTSLMNDGLNRSLTLVCAPAGYGKTTLVSNWVKETGIISTWLSLDESDNDPIYFFQYFLKALQKISPGIRSDLPDMLRGIQLNQIEGVINLLINDLVSFSSPFILVIDDFHVIQSATVFRMVTYFLEHMPNHMHLVILTRIDPPLPLSRLRVRNQLLDIRADQLRFSPAEAASFLIDLMGLKLSPSDLSALEIRTEGWIAGLQLAALSMQGCTDIHAFVSAFTGSHHYVMDYLVEEVLKQQTGKVSTFLLQTSILDRLCGPLCEAIVDRDTGDFFEGQTMLELLEEANLFLIPLDDERRWYRYHHLFSDVLKKRLKHEYPQLIPRLHHRASQWYEENEFVAESIQQAILAGDQERAAQLIEQDGCFLLISGEVATFLNWTDAIEFQSDARPWLAIQKAWALAITGELDRVEPLLQPPEKLLTPLEPTVEIKTMLGTIAAARAHCANSRGDTQSAAKYAQLALAQLPDCSSISLSIRSVAVSILGDASWIDGNLDNAIRAYTDAIGIGQNAGNDNMVIIASSNLAETLVEQGKLHQANKTYLQALNMAIRPDGQMSPLAGKIYCGLAKISFERNAIDDTNLYLQKSVVLSQQWGDVTLQALTGALMARLELSTCNPGKSLAMIQDVEHLIGSHSIPNRHLIQVKTELARLWLLQGNLERVSQYIQESGISINNEILFQEEREYLILLRTLLAQGELKEALGLSERLLQKATATGQMGIIIEIRILQALLFQELKDTVKSLEVLEKALTSAQAEGYVRLFLDEGEPMTRLLCQIRSRQVGTGFAGELLSIIGMNSEMKPPSMQLLVEPLTIREVEVLKHIEAGSSNKDIAEDLVISIPTVKRHISNIYAKLGVTSRTQAVAIGKELKIFE